MNLAELMPLLRFGFELETQSSDDMTYHNCRRNVLDRDGFTRAVDAEVARVLADPYLWMEGHADAAERRRLADEAIRLGIDVRLTQADPAAEAGAVAIRQSVRTRAELQLRPQYEVTRTPEDCFPIPDLEVGSDGTVDGFEFRTEGGLTHERVLDVAEQLLDNHVHRVDVRCSFHVHVSCVANPLPNGAEYYHEYDTEFQRRLYAYLLDHLAEVPVGVLQRWADAGWLNQYFPFRTSEDKYAFVSCHDQYPTWEFRCFGNLSTVEDARRCIDLAAGAFHYALTYDGGVVLPNQPRMLERVRAELARRGSHALEPTGTDDTED